MLTDIENIIGPFVLQPELSRDHRGFFYETFNYACFRESTGIERDFLVDSHSVSIPLNVVRGLHFQYPPKAKAKIVRVVSGAILDVIVDIRKESRTFGDYCTVKLSAENHLQLFIPEGFAHGYRNLVEHTEVLYKSSAYFDPDLAAGIHWLDPCLQIDWGIRGDEGIISEYDATLPSFEAHASNLEGARHRWSNATNAHADNNFST